MVSELSSERREALVRGCLHGLYAAYAQPGGMSMDDLANALANHLAETTLAEWSAQDRAEALREAADAWTQGAWSDVMLPKPPPSANAVIAYSNRVGGWLRDRAAALTPHDQPDAEPSGGGR